MSREKYVALVRSMCEILGAPDPNLVLQRGALQLHGYELILAHYSNDEQAMYVNFNFGITSAGRTQRVFELMLQSNLSIYSQDQAQLGVNPDTGGLLLIVRVPMNDETDGAYLADTFNHYVDHGKYWCENTHKVVDEMYHPPAPTVCMWMRA